MSYSPSYKLFSLNLATARDRFPVLSVGERYGSIIPLSIPAGSAFTLRLGPNRPPIPMETSPALCWEPIADEGLFADNPAGAGLAIFLVGISDIQGT